MNGLTLIPATAEDIPVIHSLAEKIWYQHYPAIIGPEQIAYMLNEMYSPESLREQMQVKNHLFYLLRSNNDNVGFISVHNTGNGHWFLNKFYVDQGLSGRGLGTEAFRQLKELLLPRTVRLTVNRQNYKAINFYFKNGFRIAEVADFDIGKGYFMNDFVMEMKD